MNHAISRFSLDVHSEVSQIQLDVRRWETARSLYINLTENGIPYEIAEGCTAEIAIEKPDGSILKNNCQIIENEIRYDFTSRTTVSVGMLDCEIRLLDNSGNLLTSPRFSILVHSTIYDNGDAVEQEVVNANTIKSANPGYAEVFMWSDGNPTGEDRVGYFVTADMERSAAMVKKADAESEVRGVSMATPGFASNGGSTRYDEQSNLIRNYCYVGLLGFAPVIDNGTCTVNGRCSPGADGTAVPDTTGNGYLVADRVDDTHVLILLEASSNVRINNLPGVIYPYSGANIPDGFLLCDGAAYSRTEYAELFAAIGTMYGSGDGSTTFNVPDLVERVPAGAGDNHAVGEMVGEETHTLTVNEMPTHCHGSETDPRSGTIGLADSSGTKSSFTVNYGPFSSRTDLDIRVALNGGSHPHNIMQPTTFIRGYIIATGKGSGVSVQDIIAGVQALPLGIEYGGMGATNAVDARKNLEVTPENIGAMSMELLWENASPASGMNAQDITLDTDAELYLVEYYTYNTTYSDFKSIRKAQTNRINFYGNASSSGLHSDLIVRDITITGGKLSLSDATSKGMGETSVTTVNHYLRPFRVFAVKGVSA